MMDQKGLLGPVASRRVGVFGAFSYAHVLLPVSIALVETDRCVREAAVW